MIRTNTSENNAQNSISYNELLHTIDHSPERLQELITSSKEQVAELLLTKMYWDNTVLHRAAKYNVNSLKLLIENFHDKVASLLERQNDDGDTLLHHAAQYNANSLKLLIGNFPDKVASLLKIQNNYGDTPLHHAAQYNANLLKLLIENFPYKVASSLKIQNNYGDTPLHHAALNNTNSLELLIENLPDKIVSLLEIQDNNGNTLLHHAALNNTNSLELLIENFPNKVASSLKIQNNYGDTPLHHAALNNTKSLELLIENLPDKIVSLLEIQDNNGNTLLHHAARYNKISLKLLLKNFPDKVASLLEIQNNNGSTPLHYAALNNTKLLELLIENFPDKVASLLKIQDNNGNTPLHHAAQCNKNSLKLLLKNFPDKVASLLEIQNNNGNTPLHHAAQYDANSLELLIENFPDQTQDLLKIQNKHGNTLLHHAAMDNPESLKLLIENFPDQTQDLLKIQNKHGNTLLHHAARYNKNLLELLLKNFPDKVASLLEIQNNDGNTAWHMTFDMNNKDCMRLLWNKMNAASQQNFLETKKELWLNNPLYLETLEIILRGLKQENAKYFMQQIMKKDSSINDSSIFKYVFKISPNSHDQVIMILKHFRDYMTEDALKDRIVTLTAESAYSHTQQNTIFNTIVKLSKFDKAGVKFVSAQDAKSMLKNSVNIALVQRDAFKHEALYDKNGNRQQTTFNKLPSGVKESIFKYILGDKPREVIQIIKPINTFQLNFPQYYNYAEIFNAFLLSNESGVLKQLNCMLFGQTCTNLTEDIVPLIETHLIVSIATSYMIYTAYGINNISNFGFISPALLRTAIYCAKEYSENLRAQELAKTIKQQSDFKIDSVSDFINKCGFEIGMNALTYAAYNALSLFSPLKLFTEVLISSALSGITCYNLYNRIEASQQNDGKPVEQSIFTKFIAYIAGGTTALAYNYMHPYKLSDVHITKLTIHAIKTLQYGIIAHQITNAISDLLLQEQQRASEATFETHYKYIPEQFAEFDINEESSVQSTFPFISEPEL